MSFYRSWKECYRNDDEIYWEKFLLKDYESILDLESGTQEEIDFIIEFINSIPIEYFVEHVYLLDRQYSITSKSIPQFSSLYDSIFGVCKVLTEYGNQTYKQLGQHFNVTPNDVAWLKYGSEQGYLSTIFSLAIFSSNSIKRGKELKLTNLGKLFSSIDERKGMEFIRRLCFRLDFFQLLITTLHINNRACMETLFKGISGATITRRKSSVKKIIQIMFENNSYDFWLKNIE